MNRKALGRGLRSILPDAPARPATTVATGPPPEAAPGTVEGLRQIDIDRIRPNRAQPRQSFDDEGLAALARSLQEEGVLQPVIVRPLDDGKFELLAGERRWRAAQRAGLLRIPAVVRQAEDAATLEIALVENLQREDLNPIEEAAAYRSLAAAGGLTQQQIAERFGKQRATIANALRLLTLPPAVQEKVRRGELSAGQARAIVPLAVASEQERLAERAVREGLSVRQIERLVEQAGRLAPETKPRPARRRDPNVVAAEQALQRAFGTRVRIFEGPKGGRIELHFFSSEELQRVYQVLMESARKKA